jgi:asparagine synthase (glutamine-hydrolysing)
MWFEIDLNTFEAVQNGLIVRDDGPRRFYLSSALPGLRAIEQLAESEFAQAIEVDAAARGVTFGRDYLGQYPLSYACGRKRLYVGDDVTALVDALRAEGIEPSLSPEALALYFSAGYVPHGMSVYREIVNCESTCLYRWEKGAVRKISLFEPVEEDESFPLAALGEAIEREVDACARMSDAIDVWCSGGLDSSIMAHLFNTGGRKAGLLTLSFGDEIRREQGEGERPYALEMSRAAGVRLRDVELSPELFSEMFSLFVRTFNAPVIDLPPAPKFALARASRGLVITGEGGDNLFGGPKNNHMLYAHAHDPSANLGWLLALAHQRFAPELGEILEHGDELKHYVAEYFDRQLASYPGDLVRKLFYINTLFKPSSMIFAQSYYPGRAFGLTFRHPLFALGVYKAAFTLPDSKKYSYPVTKLALTGLYGDRLPKTIVKRKKSGTQIPLIHYVGSMSPGGIDVDVLENSGLFKGEFLQRMASGIETAEALSQLQYGVMTLNEWLRHRERSGAGVPAPARLHGLESAGAAA